MTRSPGATPATRPRVSLAGARAAVTADGTGVLEWDAEVAAGAEAHWTVEVAVTRTSGTDFDANPGGHLVDWGGVGVRATDRRLDLVVEHAFADLAELVLADPDSPTDAFAAAGTPWYLTLFGRDSLWAARLTLPFGTDLAAGTLRTLARRQGRVDDPATAEQPGKILHEVRCAPVDDPHAPHLPPRYYGTVDATPLWVGLLHDAWRWGLADDAVHELRPHLDAALGWVRRAADESPDGFLRYVDATGTGLSNQGWKDSGDAMRRRDGTRGGGADRPGGGPGVRRRGRGRRRRAGGTGLRRERRRAPPLRRDLAGRVRERFWVRDDAGAFLAMALDGRRAGRRLGSNMGHVLGTGILDADEGALVAARLTSPDLLGPFGVSTLGRGHRLLADRLPRGLGLDPRHRHLRAGLVRAATDRGGAELARWSPRPRLRLPLPGALRRRRQSVHPVPYPASCRPQAWSAASAGALVTASTSALEADAPQGRLRLAPLRPAPFGDLRVRDLRVRGEPVEVEVDDDGQVRDVRAPDWLDVHVP